MLAWAAACVGGNARVVGVRALHGGEGPWLLRVASAGGPLRLVLRSPTPRIDGTLIATNVAALAVAERHGLPVDDFAAERRVGRMPTTPLLARGDAIVRSAGAVAGPAVFVHGDVWPGNMVWRGDAGPALIDWKTAGVGNPGVDLGELRKQVALHDGEDAPRHVLEGWQRASGVRAPDVPYWDAVAALNTPTRCDPPAHTARRDAFLRAALDRLNRS